MITKNTRKRIQSLGLKKNRQSEKLFVVEGRKAVETFLASSYQLESLYVTEDFPDTRAQIVTKIDMQRMSQLKNAPGVLAVFMLPTTSELPSTGQIMVLDGLSDPGNLGTLIRLCDWFGIHDIVCSPTTVDCFNPKVVQASMGSLSQVACHYTSLPEYLQSLKLPVYGTFMKGKSIYDIVLPTNYVLVFGSEAKGISKEVQKCVTTSITIPKHPNTTAESLNVSISAGVILGALTS